MRLARGKLTFFLKVHLVLSGLFSVRVNRETEPEEIDKLQRKKLELEIEIHALEREKDAASKERLHEARKVIADIEEKLQPLKAAYENQKQRGNEINEARKKLDELKAKAEDAKRRFVQILLCILSFILSRFFLQI
jgi:ATP-dependent Clp protease ATP-binding subunit ClpA